MEALYNAVVVRYGEIALKGPAVRRRFEERLAGNLSDCLRREGVEHSLSRLRGRIIIDTRSAQEGAAAAARVFGVVSSSPAISVENRIEAIVGGALSLSRGRISVGSTFAVSTKRAYKSFPMRSREVNEVVGEEIRRETGGKVDLSNPSVRIGIDIRSRSFVFDRVLKGPGGLPLGTAGRVVSLFSGGIDSPVATYLMMKRGCEPILLYFHSPPFGDPCLKDRAVEVAGKLSWHACGTRLRLLIAPYGNVLDALVTGCPRRLTCALCKRMMTRIAGEVAAREGCDAVVSGSSLSQVCSQTMANLALTLHATKLPVLMPLIGFDKEETIRVAKEIDTYESSASSMVECTAVPRNPKTSPAPEKILEAESRIDVQALVKETIEGISEIVLA